MSVAIRDIPIPGWLLSNDSVIGVYALLANEKYLYIGESEFIPKRISEHMGNLTREPEKYFGILPEEIESGKVRISIEFLEVGVDKQDLKNKEIGYIKEHRPILQQNPNSDRCILRNDRRSAVVNSLRL